jgi:peptidyl-prolyl cis-trans isomerase C
MLSGCSGRSGDDGYVARVNSTVLTQDEIAHSRDSLGEIGASEREYVNDWVIAELLYQEAERRGMTDAPEFQEQLAQTRKRLAVAALLERDVFQGVDTTAAGDEAVAAYFKASAATFALREDVVLASTVLFSDREYANVFRTRVLLGTSWEETLRLVEAEPNANARPLQSANRQYFTRMTLFPEELWKLARTIPRKEVSFPLKTNAGYTLLRIHESYRQGDIPPLTYVRKEVQERLLMDARRRRYDDLVRILRERHSVEVRRSPPDTGTSPMKE